jgi:AcrR family transcriptional regulator
MTQIRNSRSPKGCRALQDRGNRPPSSTSGKNARRTTTTGAQISAPSKPKSRKTARPCQRRAPQQRRSEDTRRAILLAAEQLLVQIGYANASTNLIAKRAGVSIGSLYQYFDDKMAVFAAVVERHKQEVKPLVLDALAVMSDPTRDLVDVSLELMRQMAQANARNPGLMFAIDHELGWLERNARDVDEQQILERVRQVVGDRWGLSRSDAAVTAQLMVTTVSHLSRWLVHGRPPELDDERFIAAIGRMLRALCEPSLLPSRVTRV